MGAFLLTHPGLGLGHLSSSRPRPALRLQEDTWEGRTPRSWALDTALRTHWSHRRPRVQ